MSHWDLINPCGMRDIEMTSMAVEMGRQVDFKEVLEAFTFHFGRVFECSMEPAQTPVHDISQAQA
jgi:lipoate-protein ligase B